MMGSTTLLPTAERSTAAEIVSISASGGYPITAMRMAAVNLEDSACRPLVVLGVMVHTRCTRSSPKNSNKSS